MAVGYPDPKFYFPPPQIGQLDTDSNAKLLSVGLTTDADLDPFRGFINALLKTFQTGNPQPMLDWLVAMADKDWLEEFGSWFPNLLSWVQQALGKVDLLGLLGKIPISFLAPADTNVIAKDGSFDTGPTETGGSGPWFWDSTIGRTKNGCIGVTSTGGETSYTAIGAPLPITESDQWDFGVWTRWSGVPGGAAANLLIRVFDASQNLLDEHTVNSISISGSSVGFSQQIQGSYTFPVGAASCAVSLQVEGLTTGTVWFDDATASKQGAIEQDWIRNLVGDLGSLFNWISMVVDALLGAFGISPTGGLQDRIFDLSDAVEGLINSIVIKPLSYLLGWIVGEPPENWDTLEEIRDNLIPALIKLPIRVIVDILGDVPIIGDLVEDGFANWLRVSNNAASSAQVQANKALAIAQGLLAGGASFTETFAGSGALDSGLWTIGSARVQRVSDNLGITTQTDDGAYQDWFVYNNQFITDDQSAGVVLGAYGSTSVDSGLFIRCNADATRFVYINIFSNQLYLGQATRSGGTWTFNDWINYAYSFNPGYSVVLNAKGDLFTVIVNGSQILQYSDTAHTGPKGASYRYAGGKIEQVRLFFTSTRSYHYRSFAISDI